MKFFDRVGLFYESMGYPLPNEEVLAYLKRAEYDNDPIVHEKFQYEPERCALFSRDQPKSERMCEYVAYIESLSWLRKSLPFVSHIYLANSITFNSLHEESDIDLLCIVGENRLRVARFCSWFVLMLLGLSRQAGRIKKKFCLSFYIEEKSSNIYTLLLQPLDIYMIFWLTHLVPMYCVHHKDADMIWKKNKRIKGYFPNHPLRQVVRL